MNRSQYILFCFSLVLLVTIRADARGSKNDHSRASQSSLNPITAMEGRDSTDPRKKRCEDDTCDEDSMQQPDEESGGGYGGMDGGGYGGAMDDSPGASGYSSNGGGGGISCQCDCDGLPLF